MAESKPESCVSVAKGPIAPKQQQGQVAAAAEPGPQAGGKMHVMVGTEAPDFEASAFSGGGFKNIKLSDYKGKWIFLCFYPGDFTFV